MAERAKRRTLETMQFFQIAREKYHAYCYPDTWSGSSPVASSERVPSNMSMSDNLNDDANTIVQEDMVTARVDDREEKVNDAPPCTLSAFRRELAQAWGQTDTESCSSPAASREKIAQRWDQESTSIRPFNNLFQGISLDMDATLTLVRL